MNEENGEVQGIEVRQKRSEQAGKRPGNRHQDVAHVVEMSGPAPEAGHQEPVAPSGLDVLRLPAPDRAFRVLAERRDRWVPAHVDEPLPHDRLEEQIAALAVLFADIEAFQDRLDKITLRFQQCQEAEERAKSDLATVYGAVDRLDMAAADVLPPALAGEDNHWSKSRVKLDEGYREELEQRRNEFFYSDDGDFLLFLGEEPHQNEERYAEAFLDAVEDLGVERVAAVAGVYGPVPYDRDRDISCVYSLRGMKEELSQYAVRFSNYEGGATISTYIAHQAEPRGIEFFTFYAIVPSYDFSTRSMVLQAIAIGEDFKAWYDLMRRLDRMFDLSLDLSDLERQGEELIATWAAKIDHLAETMPQLGVRDYMEQVNADFTQEHGQEQESFDPLSDVWEDALRDLFEEDEGL